MGTTSCWGMGRGWGQHGEDRVGMGTA